MHWLFEPILQYLDPFSFLHLYDILNSMKQEKKEKKGKKRKWLNNEGIMLLDAFIVNLKF